MSSFRPRALMVVTLLAAGCGTGTVSTTKPTGKTQANATSEDVLTSAIHQLRPENFSFSAAVDKPVSLLNSWRFKQAEVDGSLEQPSSVDAPSGWIAADDEARLAQAKFDLDDAVHIRDAFFYRVIGGYVSDRGHNELQRVGSVVDFVCRNISLWKDDEIGLPLKPFLGIQLGRGSAEDRAIICAEILRQLRIDSMILRAKSDSKETTNKWLFGAVVDQKIHLFDLCLGMPVASGAEKTGNLSASLDEIVAHPEWLDLMSTKEPYRLTVDDLRDPNIYVISESNYWCQRMRRLEMVIPASDSCIIYEPLIVKDAQTGLVNRIAKAGNWSVESLNLWRYPQRQLERTRHLPQEAGQEMQRLTAPLMVPIPFKTGEDGKFVQGTPERKLQKYRMEHLLGKFAEATQRYLAIRHLEVEQYPPDLKRLNIMASEDAFYWTSLCKVEVEDIPAAIEMLKDYLKKYDRKGKWFFAARSLLAQCQARTGNIGDAVKTLERSSSEDPYQTVNAIRLKRWTAAQAN